MYDNFAPARAYEAADFFLKVFQDMHRQSSQFDSEVDPDVNLSEATTIAEWREACDLLPWRQLANAYNDLFQIECSSEEWKTVLEPPKERTLGDVCRLLAQYAQVPKVKAVSILGSDCLSGGAFLTIRSLLKDAGANHREIAPSTPLADYTRRYLDVFLGPIAGLAPGALPPVKVQHRAHDLAIFGILLSIAASVIGVILDAIFSSPWLMIIAFCLLAVCYVVSWIVALFLKPCRVEFGQLKTFRDLANLIAGHSGA